MAGSRAHSTRSLSDFFRHSRAAPAYAPRDKVEPSAKEPEAFQDARTAAEARGLAPTRVLGRGGVGVVFATERDDTALAIKVAQPWPTANDAWDASTTKQRLRAPKIGEDGRSLRVIPPTDLALCNRIVTREHQRLGDARDEGVVKAHELFTERGRVGYVMARAEGEAVELKPGPGLAALAKTLHRLHEKSWPHGDLKPENVRVDEGARVTLIDPLPIGMELVTPEWSHLNFLVSTPLVNSADPRDRRMEYRYRDLVALALMASQAFAGERPWGHPEVARMLDRGVSMERKREELVKARDRLKKILPKVPSTLRPFLALALEPGLWPEEGPTFAAYLQARPFETRCDALVTLDITTLFADACR